MEVLLDHDAIINNKSQSLLIGAVKHEHKTRVLLLLGRKINIVDLSIKAKFVKVAEERLTSMPR